MHQSSTTSVPVMIPPQFTEVIETEVLHGGTSVLSVTHQASVDGGSLSTTAPASSWEVKKTAAEKTFTGAFFLPMIPFLTGQTTTV